MVSPVLVVASQGNCSEVIQPSTAHSKINKDISCLADEAICLVNPWPPSHVFPDMPYQLTQTLKQHALAARSVGYLVPGGARIDQKTDQFNRGMLLLIAIKSDLSGPLCLSLILFMGQLE